MHRAASALVFACLIAGCVRHEYAFREPGQRGIVLPLEEIVDDGSVPPRMHVRVVGPDGQAVKHCMMAMKLVTESGSVSNYPANRYYGGKRVFDVSSGKCWLEVWDVNGGALGGTYLTEFRPQSVKTVTVGEAVSISGRTVDARGKGMANVTVSAVPDGAPKHNHAPDVHASAETGKDGSFVLEGLGRKPYLLSCDAPGIYDAPPGFSATGGSTDVVVPLTEAQPIHVVLVDENDSRVGGAEARHIRYLDERWPSLELKNPVGLRSDANGLLDLTGADPARELYLYIQPPANRRDLVAMNLWTWTPKSETLRFASGRTVRGRVVDTEGKPVAGASVVWQGRAPGQSAEPAETDPAGRFEMHGLPRKDVILRVGMDGLLQSYPQPESRTLVPAATGEVTLRVDRGASLRIRLSPMPAGLRDAMADLVEQPAEPGTRSRSAMARVDRQGRVGFSGLRRDARYTLWIGHWDGEYVYVRDIAVQDGVITVRPTHTPRRTIAGTFQVPEGVKLGGMRVNTISPTGLRLEGSVEPGRFELRGVPEGEFDIAIWGFTAGDVQYSCRLRAPLPQSPHLELR